PYSFTIFPISLHDALPIFESTYNPLTIKVGRSLIGYTIDALGFPLDKSPLPKGLQTYLTEQAPPNPMERRPITDPIQVGVKAIEDRKSTRLNSSHVSISYA